jgi:hypothetical protein
VVRLRESNSPSEKHADWWVRCSIESMNSPSEKHVDFGLGSSSERASNSPSEKHRGLVGRESSRVKTLRRRMILFEK